MYLVDDYYSIGKHDVIQINENLVAQLQEYPGIILSSTFMAYSKIMHHNTVFCSQNLMKSSIYNNYTIRYTIVFF